MAEMEDKSWLCDLAFLVDITNSMNELNTRLQQEAQYVSEIYGHIQGSMNKLRLWHAHKQNANLSHPPTSKKMGVRPEKTKFADQLEKLFNEFSARFKHFKSHKQFFKYFLHHLTHTLTKPPLISKCN